MSLTVADWLSRAVLRLAPEIGPDEARRDARLILRHATGWSAAQLVSRATEVLTVRQSTAADAALSRRLLREPLAQIVGTWSFYGRSFEVSRDVLVPRADTETVVDVALAGTFSEVLDLGTGSGCLVVTLLAERPEASGLATDISPAALAVARRNAVRHGLDHRCAFQEGNWFEAVPTGRMFDLVVSNPPYVSAEDYQSLSPEVTEYEPRMALTPGGDGLAAYREIVAGAISRLRPNGRLVVEIGHEQAAEVVGLFEAHGLECVAVHHDLGGRERVVSGTRAPTDSANRW